MTAYVLIQTQAGSAPVGLAAWISHTVDACVTVTSFSTPSEPMMTPARTSPERLTWPTAD